MGKTLQGFLCIWKVSGKYISTILLAYLDLPDKARIIVECLLGFFSTLELRDVGSIIHVEGITETLSSLSHLTSANAIVSIPASSGNSSVSASNVDLV